MKTKFRSNENGAVLIMALLTMVILSMICATSLYVTSQHSNAGMQTASWQQALTGAESGIDAAIRALNNDGQTGAWTNWAQMSQSGASLPSTEPNVSSAPAPGGAPDSAHYNILPSSRLSLSFPNSEGATNVSSWVTIDQGGMAAAQDTNGKQWYRIRATGQATLSGPSRVSSNRMDNELRNTISLKFNRKTGTNSNLGVTRTVEVIVQPITTGGWARGITLRNFITMSGSGVIDSFDSSDPFKSTGGLYNITKRQSHGDVGIMNGSTSNLGNTYLYGNLAYSGTAVRNTGNVQGTISTPFSATVPDVSNPGWAGGYSSYSGGGSPPFTTLPAGTKSHPLLVKINGDLNISSGKSVTFTAANGGADNNYVIIWITGKYNTSGSGYVSQEAGVTTTWYVGDSITTSGGSYINASGVASAVNFVGYGPAGTAATVSGSGSFIGTLNAPNYSVTISGSGAWSGSLMVNGVTISGGASFHYDEALRGGSGSSAVGNYAFASWFEDNAIPNHKDQNGNYVIY